MATAECALEPGRDPACPDRAGETMDPVTSPLIHKDSGRQASADQGESNPFHELIKAPIELA